MKRIFLVISMIVVLFLAGCNKKEIKNNTRVVNDIENEQNIVLESNNEKNQIELNKLAKEDYSWFTTDSYHCTQPGGWGSGYPSMYYFASDNTYYWIISDYILNERVIAKKGEWKIENGNLILHEQEETYLDGGKIIEIKDDPVLGDDTILVDYTVIQRPIDNTITKVIEYNGISEYSQYNRESGDEVYEYKLDGELWYTNTPKSINRSVEEWLERSNRYCNEYNR